MLGGHDWVLGHKQSAKCKAHRDKRALDRGLKILAIRQNIASVFFDVLSRDKKITFDFLLKDCPTTPVEFKVSCLHQTYTLRVDFSPGHMVRRSMRKTLDEVRIRVFKSDNIWRYTGSPFFVYSCPIAYMGSMRQNALNLHKKMLAEPLYNVLET